MKGIGGHQRTQGRTDDWITPRWILKALGDFDLDPCCPAEMPWYTADDMFSLPDTYNPEMNSSQATMLSSKHRMYSVDGLRAPWVGRVWLNPPYGRAISPWMGKMAGHNQGTALIFARTETAWFQEFVFPIAKSILFLRRRITFCKPDGTKGKYTGGAPSCLVAYGEKDDRVLGACGLDGWYWPLPGC